MISRSEVLTQSQYATSQLVRYSLCNQQNYPHMQKTGKDTWQISIGQQGGYSIAMRDLSYKEIYDSLSIHKLFNLMMLDGALIQMLYEFRHNELLRHRLAFFPSPNLEEYQNNPEIYENDEIYADIIMGEIVPFPIRFDYDRSDKKHVIIKHPKSHLTLGQYQNCRIPISSPLTPFLFLSFILRNFYNSAYSKFIDSLRFDGKVFNECIHNDEKLIPYFKLPYD